MAPSNGFPSEKQHRPLLLGHRGASKYLPENTFEAFDLADRDRKGKLLADCLAAKFPGLLVLDEVVKRYSNRCFINVELKVEGLHDAVMAAYSKYKPQRGFLVSSFKPEALIPLYELKSDFPLGLICKTEQQLSVWGQVPIDAVFAHTSLITEELRSLTANAGKQLFVWTVNREHDMRRFARMGIDGIISDDTALLTRTLDRVSPAPATTSASAETG